MQLALNFRGAQFALLQQLVQQHAGQQRSVDSNSRSMHAPASLLEQMAQQDMQPRQQLQFALQSCLEEKALYHIGNWSRQDSHVSVHDASPYEAALRMRDSAFFSLPHILQHTLRMWRGTEPQLLQALACASQDGSAGTMLGRQGRQFLSSRSRDYSERSSRAAFDSSLVTGGLMGPTSDTGAGDGEYSVACNGQGRAAMGCGGTAHLKAVAGAGVWCGSLATANNNTSNCQEADGTCSLAVKAAMPPPMQGDQVAAAVEGAVLKSNLFEGLLAADGASSQADRSVAAAAVATAVSAAECRPCAGPVAEGVQFDSAGPGNGLLMGHSSSSSSLCGSAVRTAKSAGTKKATATGSGGDAPFSSSAGKGLANDSWLDPGVGVELLQNMGLAGAGSLPFAWAASVLLHTVLLTPRALYNSPRGRWIMRCLWECGFLVLYQVGSLAGSAAMVPD